MKILITSGGTVVPIDSVRHIANMSTGGFGLRLGADLYSSAHQVTVLHSINGASPRAVAPVLPDTCVIRYSTYWDYRRKLLTLLSSQPFDLVISAAAVSDYEVSNANAGKISSDGEITLKLTPVPKVLPEIKKIQPNCRLVGFKLLVGADQPAIEQAVAKQLENSGSDIVAFNDLNSGVRKYTLFTPQGDAVEVKGANLPSEFVREMMRLLNKYPAQKG